MPRFNLDQAELVRAPAGPPGFECRDTDIAPAIGGEHLAGSVIEIPAGRRAWPYHWEAAQEEWLIVLSGTPTVRTPGGEEVLEPGDVVCFVAGPDGAHQILNASQDACRVVMLSNSEPLNAIVYPDSDKVGVRTPWSSANFPQRAAVEYWAGE